MHFFIKNIGTEDKKIQEQQVLYIKKMLAEGKKTADLNTKEVEFIAKYMNNYMLSSRLKELGYSKDAIKNSIYIGEDEFRTEKALFVVLGRYCVCSGAPFGVF